MAAWPSSTATSVRSTFAQLQFSTVPPRYLAEHDRPPRQEGQRFRQALNLEVETESTLRGEWSSGSQALSGIADFMHPLLQMLPLQHASRGTR